jgi:hypothetical protein
MSLYIARPLLVHFLISLFQGELDPHGADLVR